MSKKKTKAIAAGAKTPDQTPEETLARFDVEAWLAGRNAALAIVTAETSISSPMAAENGQAWINCAETIKSAIEKLEPPK